MNSTIEYKGKKDYETKLKKIKEDCYKKSYNDMVKVSLENDCIPPTYGEYISDPFTIDFLDECLDFTIDEFKYKFIDTMRYDDFDLSGTSLTIIESQHEYYTIGFGIKCLKERYCDYADLSLIFDVNEFINFKDNYKSELEELQKLFPNGGFDDANIIAVMSGCGCCS